MRTTIAPVLASDFTMATMCTLMLGDDVGVEMAPKILTRKWINAQYNSPGFSVGFYDDVGVEMAPKISARNGRMRTTIAPVLASDLRLV